MSLHSNTLRAVLQGGLQVLRTPAAHTTTLYSGSVPGFLGSLVGGTSSRTGGGDGMLLQHQHSRHLAASASSGAGKNSSVRMPTRLYAASTSSGSKRSKGPAGSSSAPSTTSAGVPKDRVLQAVPGIGKVYMQRLQAEGISNVDKLADTILAQLSSAETSFLPAVLHLQKLGIKRQDHAQRIVKHITAKFNQDLYSRLQEFEGLYVPDNRGGLVSTTTPLTLCVEGNISAGKSTFLQYITNNNEELQQQLGVVQEPVEEWTRVPASTGGSTLNLLDKFYQDPEKYAYTFQNYVFMSRVMQERNSANIGQPVRLMERSVFSDRMVFVRAVKESGWMGDVELAVYDSWFGPILDTNPSLVPDGFIYLRCTPDTCMERLKMRARSEETSVPMEYLEGLHDKHEDWLRAGPTFAELKRPRRRAPNSSVVLPNGLLLPGGVSDNLKDSLCVLDTDRSAPEMHSVLNGVPALVLECDRDVLRDLDLQRHVQQTVVDYIALMRQHREQKQKQLQAKAKTSSAPSARSMSGSSSFSDRRRRRSMRAVQQGDRDGVQQQAIELVAGTAGNDFAVVPASSGQLQERAPASVSGGLEALHVAVSSNGDSNSGRLAVVGSGVA